MELLSVLAKHFLAELPVTAGRLGTLAAAGNGGAGLESVAIQEHTAVLPAGARSN
jgi:hypothetical protein